MGQEVSKAQRGIKNVVSRIILADRIQVTPVNLDGDLDKVNTQSSFSNPKKRLIDGYGRGKSQVNQEDDRCLELVIEAGE